MSSCVVFRLLVSIHKNKGSQTRSRWHFLLRVNLTAIAEKRKREGTSGVSILGLVGSKRTAPLHFMSASRISPLLYREACFPLQSNLAKLFAEDAFSNAL